MQADQSKKAELYNFGTGAWDTVDDYPFGYGSYAVAKAVYDYEMLFISEIRSFLVIGGYSGGMLSQIASFQNGVLSDAGQLNSPRQVSFCSLLFVSQLI